MRENKTGILKQHSAGLNLRYSQISELNGKKSKTGDFHRRKKFKAFYRKTDRNSKQPDCDLFTALPQTHLFETEKLKLMKLELPVHEVSKI